MGSLSAGQVVLARFQFSDLSSNKVRPCLVLGLAEFGNVILCQITSNSYGSTTALDLKRSADFAKGSIAIDSFIRPDKIVTLDQNLLLQTLGQLSDRKLSQVKSALQEIFKLEKESL